jgi:hypothetical protein
MDKAQATNEINGDRVDTTSAVTNTMNDIVKTTTI